MPETRRQRADRLLLAKGLAPSRAKAKALIETGAVQADGVRLTKVSQMLAPDVQIEVQTNLLDWVSRGALKLLAAFEAVPDIPVAGAVCADVGASTGGFVQVLLSKDAGLIYAIDVGHDQLASELCQNSKVVNLEGQNARAVTSKDIPQEIDIITCDVSFISVKKALPAVIACAAHTSWLITLIKPQFEAGRAAIGKGGVVRDTAIHRDVCADIQGWAETEMGYEVIKILPSPIEGPHGNVEFLMVAKRG